MGRTGICLSDLDQFTIESLLNRIVVVLSRKEFVDVLLPWVSSITDYSAHQKSLTLNSISNLVECLIFLLHAGSGGLDQTQRAEVEKIYQYLQDNFALY